MVGNIPPYTWRRPIGLNWDDLYTISSRGHADQEVAHSMPLGGFGSGCLERSPQGDFRWCPFDSPTPQWQPLPGCQFAVFEDTGERRHAYALSVDPPADGSLSAWQWYPQQTEDGGSTGTYSVLYPRSWYEYQGVLDTSLSCEQFSPIWAGNYQETSYPTAVFSWVAHNPSDRPITVSIMMSWPNTIGASGDFDGSTRGNYNRLVEDFHRLGCVMSRLKVGDVGSGEGQWAIATVDNPAVEVFYHTRWHPTGDGSEIWQSFSTDGSLNDIENEEPTTEDEKIAVAIAVRFTLRPGKTRRVPFFLAWDFPTRSFGDGHTYYRRYTDFFGRNGNQAWSVVRTVLKHHQDWLEKIQAWQQPILDNPDLPDSIKMALFNELYLLATGGTFWSAMENEYPFGRFGVLESWDSPYYESLDARLYGSFALLLLWPELEKSILLAFAGSIPNADVREVWTDENLSQLGHQSNPSIRKYPGATPRDLGHPQEHPFEETNYTGDGNGQTSLPSIFTLQVYRDYLLTASTDGDFLQECWPAVVQTLDYLKQFDGDGDGMPENRGIAAGSGGLWLAALEAAIAMGQELLEFQIDIEPDPQAAITKYQQWLETATQVYQEKLWNGRYYRANSNSETDVVVADQLWGPFFTQLLGLPDIVPRDRLITALDTIYQTCLVKATNKQDSPSIASHFAENTASEKQTDTSGVEGSTGITWGLAALMVQNQRSESGFHLGEAMVQRIYEGGWQFRTPAVLTADGQVRESYSLHGLAVWAVFAVLTN